MIKGGILQKDETSELCRVIFQNVYEPPVPEAVVKIDLLDPDLSYEEVMDKVTAAMASETMTLEVGEKTAMRRRLLNAWQFIRQLRINRAYQNTWRHFLEASIILFTFISNLTGVLSYETSIEIRKAGCKAQDSGTLTGLEYDKSVNQVTCDPEPSVYGMSNAQDVLTFSFLLRWFNIMLPLLNSFFISLNSLWVPGTKYTKLLHCGVNVESEIYKCRCRAGEYSAAGSSASSAKGGGPKQTDSKEDGDEEATSGGGVEKVQNPRKMLAQKLDEIWGDLGSSEIRQGMLVKPSDYELVAVGGYIKTQEHPALYDEGKVLAKGSTRQRMDVIGKFSHTLVDDGLKRLSANEYVEVRVGTKMQEYMRKAPKLGLASNTIKVAVHLCAHTQLSESMYFRAPQLITSHESGRWAD